MRTRNIVRTIFSVVCLSILASTSYAEGRYTPGTVSIGPGSGYMYADFNVRYNPKATKNSYVMVNPDVVMGHVLIFAVDDSGTIFSCYITSTSSLYAKALQVAGALGNGSRLYASRASSSECNDFLITVGSQYLD